MMIYTLEQGDRKEMFGPLYPGIVYAETDGPAGAKAAAERHADKDGGGPVAWFPGTQLTTTGISPAGERRRYEVIYSITQHRVQS